MARNDDADSLALKLTRDAKLLHAIEGLPDSHNVKTFLAAIFLGMDRKTLLRKRRGYTRKRQKNTSLGGVKGDAVHVPPLDGFPQPVNAPAAAQNFDGAIGVNADLYWNLGDLRKWKALRRGGEDAISKHQIRDFASAWEAFNEPHPWITDHNGNILDGLYALTDERFDDWLRASEHWDALIEADLRTALMDIPWVYAEHRACWHRQWVASLTELAAIGEHESQAIQRDAELDETLGSSNAGR